MNFNLKGEADKGNEYLLDTDDEEIGWRRIWPRNLEHPIPDDIESSTELPTSPFSDMTEDYILNRGSARLTAPEEI